MRIFQKGFNYSQDGPGNRLVYHTQGCNLKCRWCANPEGICLEGGKEYSVEKILEESNRSKMLFFSNGGVTFTGGEPTMQFAELMAALKGLKDLEIHTALETNGTHPDLPQLFPYIDFLIMDFKHYDSRKLKQYTGMGNKTVKKNLEEICRIGRQVHIRIPIIREFNPKPQGFVEYFSTLPTEQLTFEFLPYHEYGKEKWTEPYQIKDGFITKEILKKFHHAFKGYRIINT